MSDKPAEIDVKLLEEINAKAIQNQFFTPDSVYLDLSLLKDFPLGMIFSSLMLDHADKEQFEEVQANILSVIKPYQTRTYDTIDSYLKAFGYTDAWLEKVLEDRTRHDLIFALAPKTKFFDLLIRHTIRNQNNSRPANKYVKKKLTDELYTINPIDVTYHINTYPLTLSANLTESLGRELGESFGVNIRFHNKPIAALDQSDWDSWMKSIDCFYLNSIGEFTRNPFLSKKQENLEFVGRFFFARKRFEKCVMQQMQSEDFEQQIQLYTATLDMFCDFAWLQNNDTRLTQEGDDVPFEMPHDPKKTGS